MKSGLRGADGDPQRGRDLGHLEVEVIAEHDDRALFGRQSAKDRFEQVAVRGDDRDVGGRRAIRRSEFDLDRPSTATTEDIDARTGDEAAQPPLEPIRIAKRRQAAPCPDEPVLDRVSRELVVPEDQAGGSVQPRDEHTGKRREGVMIASLRPLDEFSLVHGPPDLEVGAAGFVALR